MITYKTTCFCDCEMIIMAALCNRAGHYIFALWFLLSSFFLCFPRLLSPSQTECVPYFHTWRGHLGTIAQLCRAISSQLGHVSAIGKKIIKQQYLLHMFLQYDELWPGGWDRSGSLGHPSNFNLRLGSVTARHCSSGHQQNFAALHRRRHLYSAGRPSRWALAHILNGILFSI